MAFRLSGPVKMICLGLFLSSNCTLLGKELLFVSWISKPRRILSLLKRSGLAEIIFLRTLNIQDNNDGTVYRTKAF